MPVKREKTFCPNQWYSFGGNCYYIDESKATWQNAMEKCIQLDSESTLENLNTYMEKKVAK